MKIQYVRVTVKPEHPYLTTSNPVITLDMTVKTSDGTAYVTQQIGQSHFESVFDICLKEAIAALKVELGT